VHFDATFGKVAGTWGKGIPLGSRQTFFRKKALPKKQTFHRKV